MGESGQDITIRKLLHWLLKGNLVELASPLEMSCGEIVSFCFCDTAATWVTHAGFQLISAPGEDEESLRRRHVHGTASWLIISQ